MKEKISTLVLKSPEKKNKEIIRYPCPAEKERAWKQFFKDKEKDDGKRISDREGNTGPR